LAGQKIFGAKVKNPKNFPVETFSARFFCAQNFFPRKNFRTKNISDQKKIAIHQPGLFLHQYRAGEKESVT
jgi:hypothetical protein